MKKSWLIIAGAVVIIAGIGTIAVLAGKNDGGKKESGNTSGQHGAHGHLGKKNACDYVTQADVEMLLGAGAEKNENSPDTSSGDLHVTTCTYSGKAQTLEEVRNMQLFTVLLRAPLTEYGAESNEKPFTERPQNAQNVTGYGEQAFWDPDLGQLNVLKDNTWMILSYGKSNPTEHTLDQTKKLADIVVPAFNKH